MRTVFDDGLRELLEKIMEMGGLAEHMLGQAVASLGDDDDRRLAGILEREERVNRLQIELDERAVSLTVQQQPVARDVRMVFVAGRFATDVERIADQATNVALSAGHYRQAAVRAEVPAELGELASAARRQLADALAAMVVRDVAAARAVIDQEKRLNQLRDETFRKLLFEMITNSAAASSALSLLLISRNLERVGDHAANVAEEVIYLVEGRDIRHGNEG